MTLTRLIQLALLCVPLIIFFFLAERELIPNGTFEIRHAIGETSPYIDALAPKERLADHRTIVGDPVYFFLHPHRAFDRLAFEIWFQNETTPLIEFGGLATSNPDRYELHPLQNRLIDGLSWPSITNGTHTLYQRKPKWNSIEAFFSRTTDQKETLAVYKAEDPVPFRLSAYQPRTFEQTLAVSLRGSHQMKTYVRDEPLTFRFAYMDMNRDEGADGVVITVFNEAGKPVSDVRAQDDGNTKGNATPSSMRELRLDVPDLQEGVYKIVLNTTRDVFVRKIHTTQQKLIFLNGLFLGDEIGYSAEPIPVRFYTTSERLRMQTRHAQGVQEISVGGVAYAIKRPYEMYVFTSEPKLTAVDVLKGDVEIFIDRPVAFSKEQFFSPDPYVIRPYTDLENSDIQYVLTTYRPPRKVDAWFVQTVLFDTSELLYEKGAWKFAFSAPDIEEMGGSFVVDQINMQWIRPPFVLNDLLDPFQ